jgi:phage terminase large subunit
MADFEASDSELVYPEFDPRRHVSSPRTSWADCKWRIAAIDPGGGDPTACYLVGVDKDERIQVYAPEFYRRSDVHPDMLVEFVAKADAVAKVQRIVIGETGGNLVTNHFRRLGYPAVKAEMAKGEGLEYVRWALQNGVISVDPGCENMIAEFGQYRWAQKRDPYEGDRYATSMPGDRHGDAMDALRYAVAAVIGQLRGARPYVVEQQRQREAVVR